ncbi:serine hydrolase domain-containing protein [Paenibacillus endoradicis]|uniref:serine hydrolase domain-containing protein n=1 Tax=Paenibacillus endoradicis TaxID=2972487 RepID=UPI0021596843|nr:serine hydrolase domain-containing protein [Paenibacillus endoradicis]MCR8660113.1 beta-lactamase family protein [Paenibacillus endoradicis]
MNDLKSITSEYRNNKKNLQLAIGIIREGDIEYYSFCENNKSAIPPENMLFEIGSITKVFTSILLLEMETENLISIDDTVGMHISNADNDYLHSITLKHLATHTSGLPRLPTNLKPSDRLNPYADYAEDQLYSFLSDANYHDQIGVFEYSNLGMGLLGHILCKRLGSTYDALLEKYITNPLKMNDTAVLLNTEQKSKLLNGHTSTGKRVPHWDASIHEGAGGIKSSLSDMCLFVQANLENKNLLSSNLLKSHVPVMIGSSNHHLSWVEDNLLGENYLWHNGGTYGFTSYLALNKELGIGIVLLSNYCYGSISIMDHLINQLKTWITRKEPTEGILLDTIGKEILEKLLEEELHKK